METPEVLLDQIPRFKRGLRNFDKQIETCEKRIEKLRKKRDLYISSCPGKGDRKNWTYHGDPSGNGDDEFSCDVCLSMFERRHP